MYKIDENPKYAIPHKPYKTTMIPADLRSLMACLGVGEPEGRRISSLIGEEALSSREKAWRCVTFRKLQPLTWGQVVMVGSGAKAGGMGVYIPPNISDFC